MSTEIYYFSGTGNSLFIARELQKRLPGTSLIPIVSLLNEKEVKVKGEAVGLVFPAHALTIPIAVKKFIEKLDLGPAKYIFAIATREGTVFRGFEKIDRLLKKNKRMLDSHFIINMWNTDSRSKYYRSPSESDILALEKAALEKLDLIKDIIINKEKCREADTNFRVDFNYHPIVNFLLEKSILMGMTTAEHTGGVNYFYTDSNCTRCGICERVCLSGKIKMDEGKPVWQKKVLCYMCFACLNFCPKHSVQIKSIPYVESCTKVNGRYPHPYAAVKDISSQKRLTNEK